MRDSWAYQVWRLAMLVLSVGWPGLVAAQTIEAPIGGAAIPVGAGLVACAPAGGWALEAGGAQLRPPSAESAAGTSAVVRVAASLGACPQSKVEFPISRDDHTPAFIFGPSISIGNLGANLF